MDYYDFKKEVLNLTGREVTEGSESMMSKYNDEENKYVYILYAETENAKFRIVNRRNLKGIIFPLMYKDWCCTLEEERSKYREKMLNIIRGCKAAWDMNNEENKITEFVLNFNKKRRMKNNEELYELQVRRRYMLDEIHQLSNQIMYKKIKQSEGAGLNLKKLKNDLLEISKDKSVKYIDLDTDKICIHVKKQKCFEAKEEKLFRIPESNIEIDLNDGRVRIYPADWDDTVEGFWGKQIHPHVSDAGDPCLGNADAMLIEAWSKGEIYNMYLTVLYYLQSVNIDDIAGQAIPRWDEVDEVMNVITKGHDPTPDDYPDDVDCNEALERYSKLVYCEEDGEYYPSDEVHYCDICDSYVHNSHWDDELDCCEDCAENFTTNCDGCDGRIVLSDGDFYTTPDDRHYCGDCEDEWREYMRENFPEYLADYGLEEEEAC